MALAFIVPGAAGAAQAQIKFGDNPTTINPGSLIEAESPNRGVLVTPRCIGRSQRSRIDQRRSHHGAYGPPGDV